jgi:DNA-binding transcriptional LysR family regulator
MHSLDLRLLSVFDEVRRTRSVTRAAEALGLGQPAVSIALARLRDHFGEPLFVRTAHGMAPTPLALELEQPIREALTALERALGHRSRFDPVTARRSFAVSMSDISQLVLLPRLLARLHPAAPGVSIETLPLSADTPRQLEAGEADLAIGFLPRLDAGFYQQTLFPQRYVCMASAAHPRIRDTLTLEQFEREGHAVVSGSGTGHPIVDRALERLGVRRRVVLRIPNYVGVALIIERTELLVTIPLRLAEELHDRDGFRIFEPPMPLPTYEIKQHWHERFQNDPGHRWLRALVGELLTPPAPGR